MSHLKHAQSERLCLQPIQHLQHKPVWSSLRWEISILIHFIKYLKIINKNISNDQALKSLYLEHLDFERQLEEYNNKSYLTPSEEMERKMRKSMLKAHIVEIYIFLFKMKLFNDNQDVWSRGCLSFSCMSTSLKYHYVECVLSEVNKLINILF